MYDITNRSSFDHVTEWMKSARQVGAVTSQSSCITFVMVIAWYGGYTDHLSGSQE